MNDPAAQARAIFDPTIDSLRRGMQPERLDFPINVVWLGGAPGAGKGTQTPVIQRLLGINAEPVVMSSLLRSPEMERLKASGKLVGDREVLEALFKELLDPTYRDGAIVDGFPRTRAQAECVKMLAGLLRDQGRSPAFRVIVFDVSEEVAVQRQLGRGAKVRAHNRLVAETGEGEMMEERPTDNDENLCSERYRTYQAQTLDALAFMADTFPFAKIDGNGTIEEVRAQVVTALS